MPEKVPEDSLRSAPLPQETIDAVYFPLIVRGVASLAAGGAIFLGGVGVAMHESHQAGSPIDVTSQYDSGQISREHAQERIDEITVTREHADDIKLQSLLGGASITAAGLGISIFAAQRKLRKAGGGLSSRPAET